MNIYRQNKFNKIILKVFQIAVFFFIVTECSISGLNDRKKTICKDQTMEKGIYEKELKLRDGSILRYTVSLPGTKRDAAAPLVLALHYGGEVTPYYGKGYLQLLAAPAFQDLKAVILAPDCPGRGWTDPKSEAAVLELIEFAAKTLSIDQSQVIVTGFSMGGIGTWYLSGRHPDIFCAAVPVAARPYGEIKTNIPV